MIDPPDLSPGSSPWDTNRTNRTRSSGGKYESALFLTPPRRTKNNLSNQLCVVHRLTEVSGPVRSSTGTVEYIECWRHRRTYFQHSKNVNQLFENYPGPYSLTSFKQDDVPDLHSTIPAALHSAFVLAFTQEKQRILGFCFGGFLSITT